MAHTFDDFNAMQFVDLTAEEPFLEQHGSDHQTERSSSNCDKDPLAHSYEQESQDFFTLRKSLSVGTLVMFSENGLQDKFLRENIERLRVADTDVPVANSSVESLAKPGHTKKTGLSDSLGRGSAQKFISFAESVRQFQNRTPQRFRSNPELKKNPRQPQRTVPHSPALRTKLRHRNIHIPSREEKEMEEYENAKKFKIKAQPVSQKVLRGPVKAAELSKKPITVPEPFAITCPPPKKVAPPEPNFEFHARPVPKSVREPLPEAVKRTTPRPRPTSAKVDKPAPTENKPMKKTQPEPFSFEERDKMCMSKRQQLIHKILEEERRAREFHARPMPKSLYGGGGGSRERINSSSSSAGSSKKSESQENVTEVPFRARPPVVLTKAPFVPKKADRPCVTVEPFFLNTEQRALERGEFQRELLEKEERLAAARRLAEERRLEAEREEIEKLRRAAEIKAQPVKKYKPIQIKPANKVTEPVSPNFHWKRNKENVSDNPVGGASAIRD
ncbi:targeting protein for Xklp2 homolog [Cylas formicarius]|uniref:targeting protein for Xklp2 homolog n=1 Tax=Cylas formicarius TaxID=197179 RepID=UPI00295872F8|nr:targeting protein for Xklp2 homolog [Cylas formicarius]